MQKFVKKERHRSGYRQDQKPGECRDEKLAGMNLALAALAKSIKNATENINREGVTDVIRKICLPHENLKLVIKGGHP